MIQAVIEARTPFTTQTSTHFHNNGYVIAVLDSENR
jgi:hypothetical protein